MFKKPIVKRVIVMWSFSIPIIFGLFTIVSFTECQLDVSIINCPSIIDQIADMKIDLSSCSEELTNCLMQTLADISTPCANCMVVSEEHKEDSVCVCVQCLLNLLSTRCSIAYCSDLAVSQKLQVLNKPLEELNYQVKLLTNKDMKEVVYLPNSSDVTHRGIFPQEHKLLVEELMALLSQYEEKVENVKSTYLITSEHTSENVGANSELETAIDPEITGKSPEEKHTIRDRIFKDETQPTTAFDSELEPFKGLSSSGVVTSNIAAEVVQGIPGVPENSFGHYGTEVADDRTVDDQSDIHKPVNTSPVFMSKSNSVDGGKAVFVSIFAATLALIGIFAITNTSTYVKNSRGGSQDSLVSISNSFFSGFKEPEFKDFSDSEIESELLTSLAIPIPYPGETASSLATKIHLAHLS
ncbi:HFL042Cp [Eremothecium sinecaudum]|uniref:HFL042Cp n=1 Tax=Eremothecium sinecaudum TaxID=45286 RepID=A0A0X8HUN7_9SACH|nr:HFL042Cp [Eremothecium sinecaudum]AMD21814.1 HFL042Cp [Eremothecium sinecaudum]